ncbi:MAG: hypothetical protein ACJ72L_13715 [Marmoricola sp.]
MGVETAIELVYRREVDTASDPRRRRAELIATFKEQLGAVRGAEGFGVDAVVRPSETRSWLSRTMDQLPRRREMQTLTPRRHPVAPLKGCRWKRSRRVQSRSHDDRTLDSRLRRTVLFDSCVGDRDRLGCIFATASTSSIEIVS